MDTNCEGIFKIMVYVIGAYISLRILQDNCDIGLGNFFKSVEGFALGDAAPVNSSSSGIAAAESSIGANATLQPVEGIGRTPSSCYPQPQLSAQDLLPKEDSQAIQEFNIAKPVGEGILEGLNLLDSTYHVGVNTVGQSLKNANLQLRSEPPNPQVAVSPWQNSSIAPDLLRRPLEGTGCAASTTSEPVGA